MDVDAAQAVPAPVRTFEDGTYVVHIARSNARQSDSVKKAIDALRSTAKSIQSSGSPKAKTSRGK